MTEEPQHYDGLTHTHSVRHHLRHQVYFLLDRSGSMSSIQSDVEGGLHGFIAEQKKDESTDFPTFFTLAQFDTEDPFELTIDGLKLSDISESRLPPFKPRSMTPLLDAIGHVIDHASKEEDAKERKDVPVLSKSTQNTVIVVFSDGQENSSRKFTRSQIFERIEGKKSEGWAFIFLGANQDSYAEGSRLGLEAGSTQNFGFNGGGVGSAFKSLSRGTFAMKQSLSMSAKAAKAAIESAEGAEELQRQADASLYDPANFFGGKKEAEEQMSGAGSGN